MLIDYKKANVLNVHYALSEKECDTVKFMPGINEVSRKKWEQIVGHPKVKKFLNDKTLELVTKEDPKEGESGILDLKPHEAASVIKKTFDLEKLEDWKSKDSRKFVIKALDLQIKFVNDHAKKGDKETD